MNLVKKDVNDKKYGAVTNFDDLKYFLGMPITILMHDTGVNIEIVACERMWDISFFAMQSKAISKPVTDSAFMLLEVMVVDPADLPYELYSDEEMFVIYDEWHFTRFPNVEPATRDIESTFNWYEHVEIGDFVVLVGKESPEYLLNMVLNRMNIGH